MSAPRWKGTEPLPPGGVYVLEASAGTGKTWQIAHLVSRLVVLEDVPIQRLLVVTFTRAATGELRHRIGRRLAQVRGVLQGRPEVDDAMAAWLDEAVRRPDGPGVRRACARIDRALAHLDEATVSTIHGFCQRALGDLALESGLEPGMELVEDIQPVVDEVVNDLLVRLHEGDLRGLAGPLGATRRVLGEVARRMTGAVAPALPAAPRPLGELVEVRRAVEAGWAELDRWLDEVGRDRVAGLLLAQVGRKGISRSKKTGWAAEAVGEAAERLRAGPLAPTWDQVSAGRVGEVLDGSRWVPLRGGRVEPPALLGELFGRARAARLPGHEACWATLASWIREETWRRLGQRRALCFATLIDLLARALAQGPEAPAARALRARYDVALVDEAQDTDLAQWRILNAVFATRDRRLLLIGDPKQAIYGFRGADVHAYLDQAGRGSRRWTMEENHRSVPSLVEALNAIWTRAADPFGVDGIAYVPVRARRPEPAAGSLPAREDGRPRRPVEFRVMLHRDGEPAFPRVPLATTAVVEDCAGEVARLLASGRGLAPSDIAVLVRSNGQAMQVWRALVRRGVNAVLTSRESVFHSPVAAWLADLLDALAAPGDERQLRRFALGPLGGWTVRELAALVLAEAPDEALLEAWLALRGAVDRAAERWSAGGFVGALEALLADPGLRRAGADPLDRLRAGAVGLRWEVDLRHLVELLHQEERRSRAGPGGLAAWLRRGIDEGGAEVAEDAVALRLASEGGAVQVATLHASKGLEYEVVLLPFAWKEVPRPRSNVLVVRGEDGPELVVEATPGGGRARRERAAAEMEQEEMRLLYVGMTRARRHLVAWLAATGRARGPSPLGRLLGFPDGRVSPGGGELDGLLAGFGAHVGVTRVTSRQARAGAAAAGAPVAAGGSRPSPAGGRMVPVPEGWRISGAWQVASFTSMVLGRGMEDEPVQLAAEAERPGDVPASRVSAMVGEGPGWTSEPRDGFAGERAAAHLEALRGGRVPGTWVHAVLEHLDFRADPPRARDGRDLPELIRELGVRHGVVDPAQHAVLEAALPAVLATPLGAGAGDPLAGLRLADLPLDDRLDELPFDLRLGAGVDWRPPGGARVQDAAVRAALEPAAQGSGSRARWVRRLLERAGGDAPALPRVAGILTGVIDLVFRTGEGPPEARVYWVADYKTNRCWLPDGTEDYGPACLAAQMERHGYHLQALVYTVALHRHLELRLGKAYDPARHLGGTAWLFLRGMTGPAARRPGHVLGVARDRWPPETVRGLSVALAGGGTEEVRAAMAGGRP